MAHWLHDWDGEKDGYGRTILQRIGREGREISYKIWVNYLLYQMFEHIERQKKYKVKKYRFIVPDVRFDDEVVFFNEHFSNVTVYKVVRDNYVSTLTDEQKNDITERGVSERYIDKVVKL